MAHSLPVARSATPRAGWAGCLLVLALLLGLASSAQSLQGATGVHDPSTIIKRNGVYHTWATGDQIYHLTSTDLIQWSVAAPVFAPGTWPGWINSYVTGFRGFFWAPECVFMNGKYYMYYSCSTGQRPSAIGLATSPDLVNWTDQGMVVYSDNGTAYGSIDPAIFTDAAGRLWMSFGSHLTGIWNIELDPATGKRLNITATNVAGSGPASEHEAPYMMQRDGYYYLLYNRGTCCAGTNSTYYVQMGRATSPNGPFVDRNGVALLSGGGTNFLVRQNNFYGPGHVGLLTENGANFLSYHYYDATRNGAPTLGIASLSWDAQGWPAASQDWLPAGTYTLSSAGSPGSGKVWAAAGCTAASGQALVLAAPTGQPCQQWRLTPQGSGVYTITNVLSNLSLDVADCEEAVGTALRLRPASEFDCQRFRLSRAADGSLTLASIYGNRVIGAATADGTTLTLLNYNSNTAGQRWLLNAAGTATATTAGAQDARIQLFPNPAPGGNFTVALPAGTAATITVADISGRVVFRQQLRGSRAVRAGLGAGAYVVQIQTVEGVVTRKLLVL